MGLALVNGGTDSKIFNRHSKLDGPRYTSVIPWIPSFFVITTLRVGGHVSRYISVEQTARYQAQNDNADSKFPRLKVLAMCGLQIFHWLKAIVARESRQKGHELRHIEGYCFKTNRESLLC